MPKEVLLAGESDFEPAWKFFGGDELTDPIFDYAMCMSLLYTVVALKNAQVSSTTSPIMSIHRRPSLQPANCQIRLGLLFTAHHLLR
jgi:hypothetical protein